MNAKEHRERYGLSQSQAVDILKAHYPSMDKPLLSKAENPEKSGVMLTPPAMRILHTMAAGEAKRDISPIHYEATMKQNRAVATASYEARPEEQRMHAIEARRESYRRTDRHTRHQLILAAWNGSMTAREIGNKLGFFDLNAVKPRITELVRAGLLEEDGKKYDPATDRNVTCWRKPDR